MADHLKKRRFDLKLQQKEVAGIIGVSDDTITNWENGKAIPKMSHRHKVISFLGYNPYAVDTTTLGGRIRLYRHLNGLSQKRFGKLIGVDASTVRSWEEDKFWPSKKNRELIDKQLKTI